MAIFKREGNFGGSGIKTARGPIRQRMRTVARLVLLGSVLLVVALFSGLMAMQIAIHGRETTVPDVVSRSPDQARKLIEQAGMSMEIERQYFSPNVSEGKILSQVPTAGSKVRRGWQVRVAESLGPQRVEIPNVLGESGRAAQLNIRRRSLEIGSIAETAIPETLPDKVVAQNPIPNASDVSAPKISLLVTATSEPEAFVTPNFVGQTLASVRAALQVAGLREGNVTLVTAGATINPSISSPPAAISPASIVISHDPVAGQKIVAGSALNLVVR